MASHDHGAVPISIVAPSSVLARRQSPHVEWVAVEGEVVAWNADEGALHLLDPIASIIFLLCDGETALEVTAADLAQAFSRDLESIRGDVIEFATSLEQIGLVERA